MVTRRSGSRLVGAGLAGLRAPLRRRPRHVALRYCQPARSLAAAQCDACSTRLISRASSAAVQADSSTPSREAHSRRASGPLPALTHADPKFHAG